MKRIFWGMLLIMIDLTIMNGVFYLDLLPDFLGVLLCLWGMAQLDDVWHESRIRGFLCFYAFYTVADLLMGMYGIIFSPITMSLMPVLSNIMTLYLAAELTSMIRHMENQTCCLYGKELHASWSLLCISLSVTTFIFLVKDVDTLFGVFGIAQWLAAMITIFLMVSFLISTALWLSYFFLAARQYTHCHDQVSTMHHRTNPVL